jgi:hypothetical protein
MLQGMVVLGCGKQVLGVRATKTTILREFECLLGERWGFDFSF